MHFLSAHHSLAANACTNLMAQTDINICAANKAQKSETQLEEVYRQLLEKIRDAEGKEKLRTAEEAWLDYQKKQCAFDTFGTATGSINAMVYANCVEEMTLEQTKRLRRQLDCEEGDLSCGNQ